MEHIFKLPIKKQEKVKTQEIETEKDQEKEAEVHTNHISSNRDQYNNLLTMHNHFQKAKDVLVKNLEKHTGGLEHHIDNKPTGPEGFVVNHAGEPTKLVNRKEFAKANLLKVRK